MLRALNMAVEAEMEDDGLFMLTLWLEEVPHYVAICRDLAGENPNRIWVEWEDQITGHHVDGLNFAFDGDTLSVQLLGEQPFAMPLSAEVAQRFDMGWVQGDGFQIDVAGFDVNEIARVLWAIQGGARCAT